MYSFEPTEEQKMVIDAARKLAAKEYRPRMREADEKGEPEAAWMDEGWELALLPASIPEQFGGFGANSALTWVLAAEELAWGDLSGAMALLAPNLVALPVLRAGTPEQKAMHLPAYCNDAWAPGAAALMEPRIEFDPFALETKAERTADGYRITGRKCNVPFALESDWVLVYAALEGATQGFLVPTNAPGVTVGERERNMGLRALPLYSLNLADCVVPAANRLGGEQGCDFDLLLATSRTALASLAVGVARAAYEFTLDYTKQRTAFGEPLAQRQSIAFTLAELIIDIDAARLLAWEAAWNLDNDRDAVRAAAFALNFASDMALRTADRAVQLLGGYGYVRDYPVELWLRNARAFGVMEGIATV